LAEVLSQTAAHYGVEPASFATKHSKELGRAHGGLACSTPYWDRSAEVYRIRSFGRTIFGFEETVAG
jgi:hypothetical protein